MMCPKCNAQGRILNVDERAPKGVTVTYVCPNPRCASYKQEFANEVLRTTTKREEK